MQNGQQFQSQNKHDHTIHCATILLLLQQIHQIANLP